MKFTHYSGEEQGWRCAYGNLKVEDQEETGAPEGVERGKSSMQKQWLGLKVLGSATCGGIYPSFRRRNGLEMELGE